MFSTQFECGQATACQRRDDPRRHPFEPSTGKAGARAAGTGSRPRTGGCRRTEGAPRAGSRAEGHVPESAVRHTGDIESMSFKEANVSQFLARRGAEQSGTR
jgi:hypothetical protein